MYLNRLLNSSGYSYKRHDYDFSRTAPFFTGLSRAGVSLKSAQELARHSKPELTANVYTHLSIKDAANDVEKMPAIPSGQFDQQVATGTNDGSLSKHMAKQVLRSKAISGDKLSLSEGELQGSRKQKGPRNMVFHGPLISSPGRARTYDKRINSTNFYLDDLIGFY